MDAIDLSLGWYGRLWDRLGRHLGGWTAALWDSYLGSCRRFFGPQPSVASEVTVGGLWVAITVGPLLLALAALTVAFG